MGYKVDFDALDTLYYSINNKAVEWSDSLGEVYDSVNALAASECITGAGAENIKSYLSEVHSMVIGLLGQIIASHTDNCLLYKRDYQDNIDSSVHAVIYEDELTDIASRLQSYRSQTSAVDSNIESALTSISDIFYNQSYRGYSTVDNDYETTKRKIDTLDQDIHSLENSHLNSDFTNTEVLLDKLIAYLNTQLGKSKSYKTEFNLETAQKDTTLQEIARAYQALSEENDAKREALAIAGENEQARIEILQKEYEDRQNTATVINWVVTGLCIVGSVAIVVGTCGGATPVAAALVAGSVSAGSGVIISVTNDLTSQWAEYGNLKNTDWMNVGKNALLSGATGFVTGFVGSLGGYGLTTLATKAPVIAPLVNSSSTVTRVSTHFVIGGTSEVVTGGFSRFVEGIVTTGDWDTTVQRVINPQSVLLDFAIGGVSNGIKGKNRTFSDMMSPEDAPRYKNWMKVREGEIATDYIYAGEELGTKLKTEGYKIIKTETANSANADWYDMGFDKPPIAENTIAYTVEAGNHSYSRVYLEGYNNPMSSFIVRTDEISGLSAEEIAQKLALSKVPNRVVSVDLPPTTPLEVSIVGPQPDWGTIGGDVQFAIKDVDLNPMWFRNIKEIK